MQESNIGNPKIKYPKQIKDVEHYSVLYTHSKKKTNKGEWTSLPVCFLWQRDTFYFFSELHADFLISVVEYFWTYNAGFAAEKKNWPSSLIWERWRHRVMKWCSVSKCLCVCLWSESVLSLALYHLHCWLTLLVQSCLLGQINNWACIVFWKFISCTSGIFCLVVLGC